MLPREVYRMCVAGALIVGSRALVMAGHLKEEDANPNDYDLLVPYDKWQAVTPFLPADAKINKFGGWRFKIQTDTVACEKMVEYWGTWMPMSDMVPVYTEVDVWPGSIEQYLQECKSKHGVPVCVVDYINNRVYSAQVKELAA